MVARTATIDPDRCVAAFGKPFDAGISITFPQLHAGNSVQPGTNKRSNPGRSVTASRCEQSVWYRCNAPA